MRHAARDVGQPRDEVGLDRRQPAGHATGGRWLEVAPANATFLEARDAIIEADVVDTGGDNFVEIWTAFAKRGMGFSAQCPTSDTTTGVIEAYDVSPDIGVPDGILELKVTPPSGTSMFAGETNTILVRVSDSLPVTNATVTGTITGGTDLVFRNDGVAPDQLANNSVSSAFLKVPTNQPTVTITLIVSAPGKDTATNVVTYLVIPVPPNDYFTNATKVPVAGTNYFTNNKRATLETNEPVHANVSSRDRFAVVELPAGREHERARRHRRQRYPDSRRRLHQPNHRHPATGRVRHRTGRSAKYLCEIQRSGRPHVSHRRRRL